MALPSDATAAIISALERLLGLQTDLTAFYEMAAEDLSLVSLAQTYRGFKPPRFLSLFEGLVNAISCQQLTLTLGIQLQNRLSERCGAPFLTMDSTAHAFPCPKDLARVDVETLRAMGYSRQKALAIIGLACAITEEGLDLDSLELQNEEMARSELLGLRGIGRWSAEYVLLRGIGLLHVFPGDDVGARNNLRRWLCLAEPLNYESVSRLVARWQPYAGLIYFHLLLRGLDEAGHIEKSLEPNAAEMPANH